jgi:hypothetical protein
VRDPQGVAWQFEPEDGLFYPLSFSSQNWRFIEWLNHNRDVFIAYKASLGLKFV